MRTSRIPLLIAMTSLLGACMMFTRPPTEAKYYDRTQTSAARMYTATYAPAESIRVGKLHAWTVRIVGADGAPVSAATITVDGGMPQHGHGLPTKPVVTKHLGDGAHLVEGMKFNMGGWWVVKLRIAGAQGSDDVTFNLKL